MYGGFKQRNRTSDIYSYKFHNNTWTLHCVEGSTPVGRADHSAIYFSNSMWIFGGTDDETNKLNDLWEYNISENTWSQVEIKGDIIPKVSYQFIYSINKF